MNINCSIIIPHKNIPHLLLRCLNSIPIKQDLEIIIVDDNSDNIDKKNFPGLNRFNTYIIFSDVPLTAGGARNMGLSIAKGKFVLFADADDFFYENFYDIIKPFFFKTFDLIYFGMNSVDSETLAPAKRGEGVFDLLLLAKNGDLESQNLIKYKFLYPSCKLINRELINKFKIRFDEVPASNDTMFGIKVSTKAKSIIFEDKIIYCLTYRKNSLVTSYKYENLKSRLKVSFVLYKYLKELGLEKYAQSSVSHWLQIRHSSILFFIKDFFVLVKSLPFTILINDFGKVLLNKRNV